MNERRRAERFNFTEQPYPSVTFVVNEMTKEAYLLSISSSGLFMALETEALEELNKDSVIGDINFNLKEDIMIVNSRIAYILKGDGDSWDAGGLGIEFGDMGQTMRDGIDEFVRNQST